MKSHIIIIFIAILVVVFVIAAASGKRTTFKIFDYELFKEQIYSFKEPVFKKRAPVDIVEVIVPQTETSTHAAAASTDVSSPAGDKRAVRPPEFLFPVAMPSRELRTAAILEVPLPKNIHCISEKYADAPECYAIHHYALNKPRRCALYANPVSDSEGIVYPSACWAEELGVANFSYGHSERMTQFIRNLWRTPRAWWEYGSKSGYKSFDVPKPHAEFSFEKFGWEENRRLFSTLWSDPKTEMYVDYSYDPKKQKHTVVAETKRANLPVVSNEQINMLLAFVLFDNAYPENVLLNEGRFIESYLNVFFEKNQEASQPLRVRVTPVVIDPPSGVSKPNEGGENWFASGIITKIREAATKKTGINNFHVLASAPVFVDPGGKNVGPAGAGSSSEVNEQVIRFFINPPIPYSKIDVRAGLLAFEYLRIIRVIRHELLHILGWGIGASHDPWEINDYGANLQTGEYETTARLSECDMPYATAFELPSELQIRVGEEPPWLGKAQSKSGTCLFEKDYDSFPVPFPRQTINMQDADADGTYELLYGYEEIPADTALTRSLGWRDINGDGVGEVADPDPYGGFKEVVIPARSGAKLTALMSFESLGEAEFQGCRFERIRLENGEAGLLPLRCQEFNEEIVNVYKNMEYLWLKVPKEYGLVLLPRFSTQWDYGD